MEENGNNLNRVAIEAPIERPFRVIDRHRNPLALWHLLSLDAPVIAALWTWFIAYANHVQLPLSSTLSMALAVWMLYAADRLMDARLLDIDPSHHEGLEARHYFHHRHRSAFLTGIVLSSIALAAFLPHLDASAIHLYLILGGLVAGYFILIHATRSAHRFPKEIAVGLCFAAATFIPTVARRPDLRSPLFPSALLFAALCSLNCLFIYFWEHEDSPADHPVHVITRLALNNLPPLAILLSLVAAVFTLLDPNAPWPIPCSIAYSAALLLVLHYHRLAIEPITLRAFADLALTTPLLLLFFLHR